LRADVLNGTRKPSPDSSSTGILTQAITPDTCPVPEGGE
jgi:hypothetical protein